MSTSLLYHAFGINGYKYIHTRYEKGAVIFRIAHDKFSHRCSICNSKQLVCRGKVMRRFRTIPIGLKLVFIEIEIQRVFCLALPSGEELIPKPSNAMPSPYPVL